MSLQKLIAPYLNRFVILFIENATAKLELSCAEGKVHVNMFHDLGAPKQTRPPAPPVKKAGYSEVLKNNLKTSQLNRLKRGAAVQAEEAETQTLRQNPNWIPIAEKLWRNLQKLCLHLNSIMLKLQKKILKFRQQMVKLRKLMLRKAHVIGIML